MTGSEALALLVNIAVGVWLVRFYPDYLRRRITPERMPRLFGFLLPAARIAGLVIIAGTVAYALLRLFG